MKTKTIILAVSIAAGTLHAQQAQILGIPAGGAPDLTTKVPDFGTSSRAVKADEAKTHQLKEHSGFVIEEVESTGTAATLGLLEGDVVTKIGDRPVKNLDGSLDMAVANVFFEGETLKFEWLRDGAAQSGTATLDQTCTLGEMMTEMMGNLDLSSITGMGSGGNMDLSGLLKGLNLGELTDQIGKGGVPGVSVNTVLPLPDGAKAMLANGKLRIVDAEGEEIYSKEDFSVEKDLQEVPEQYRNHLGALKMLNFGRGGNADKVEDSTNDLLDKAEAKDKDSGDSSAE
ncbi:PDZ domain-containing protein [Haloferula sp.]|uniref:PDZ domain-containing protein n=1 Tax=Haloferula sp. TaxID=2497595 RepID=UPI003C778102